jgi:NADH-quinone oxidoreductase subunit J
LASEVLMFYGFGAVAVIGALLVVLQKNPVYSVLSLIGAFFGLSGLYVLLEAPFVAVVQIIIYAGAIMVLFLFTVMLLNVPREDAAEWDRAHPLYRPMAVRIGGVLAVLLALELGWALSRTAGLGGAIGEERPAVSSVTELGKVLFTDYMFAFEVTSILIIASMVGAVVLARKRDE